MEFMEQRLIDLIHNARRWADHHYDFLPTLGCSNCGKGCVPLCGLGLNKKVSPMGYKEVVLKSRKCMLETGRTPHPMQLQFVGGTDIVIMFEKALDCMEKREIPGNGQQWVFTKPIPTLCGLMCKECSVCFVCRVETTTEIRACGRLMKVCARCSDTCAVCCNTKIKHHSCCTGLGKRYFSTK